MGIPNPENLSMEEHAEAYAAYLFLRKHEREFQLNILRQVLRELLEGQDDE